MGGVNFTRNRAWWHTVIWDEYGQRHQYLAIIPTFAILIPFYWYGSFINREIEQNFAFKMYHLEYEQKRLRLTHNLIMENFEMHVEEAQKILEDIKENGFEHTFKEQIEAGLFKDFPKEKDGYSTFNDWDNQKMAEFRELAMMDKSDNLKLHEGFYSLDTKLNILKNPRRKYPGTPFKFLDDIPLSFTGESVDHHVYVPTLNPSKYDLESVKSKITDGVEMETD